MRGKMSSKIKISLDPRTDRRSLEPGRRVLQSASMGETRDGVALTPVAAAPSPALGPFAAAPGRSDRWLAAAFPLLTLALLWSGRNPDDRLRVSAVDAVARVLGVISLATVATVAAGSIAGTEHVVPFAMRLWLFAAVGVAV